MSKGMSFEEARNRANAEGYTPQSHDKTSVVVPTSVGGIGAIKEGDNPGDYYIEQTH